jgi:hypothetical protein
MEVKVTLTELLVNCLKENYETSYFSELMDGIKIINDVFDLDKHAAGLEVYFKNGPIYDGDIPSKQQRDLFLEKEFVVKVIKNGEWGFNALTHRGAWGYKVYEYLRQQATQNPENTYALPKDLTKHVTRAIPWIKAACRKGKIDPRYREENETFIFDWESFIIGINSAGLMSTAYRDEDEALHDHETHDLSSSSAFPVFLLDNIPKK